MKAFIELLIDTLQFSIEQLKKLYSDYHHQNYQEIIEETFNLENLDIDNNDPILIEYPNIKNEAIDFSINKLIISKNKKWLPKMINYLQKDSMLIIVGILHLASNEGIIAKLREKGYQVTPVLDQSNGHFDRK